MKNICASLVAILAASIYSSSVLAAGVPSKCKVSADGKLIGEFEAEVGEERLTTKAFKIPGTKLVATAQVFYTDEYIRVKWADSRGYLDLSTSIKISAGKKAKTDKDFGSGDFKTRAILTDWGDVNAGEFCQKALADKEYAKTLAEGESLNIFLESCEAFIKNSNSNVIETGLQVKKNSLLLTCSDSE